jgi:hypothetical protein
MGGLVTYSGSSDLASAALSLTTNVAATGRVASGFTSAVAERRKLDHVTLHASVAISETVTLTLNSRQGSAYDIVLDTSALGAESDYQYVPLSPVYLGPGDNLTLACTNANTTGTVSAAIVCEE